MPSIKQLLLALLLLAAVRVAVAASPDAYAPVTLAATPRMYVTLAPRAAEEEDGPRFLEGSPGAWPGLNLPLRSPRRNRLEFSMTQRDLLTSGDKLQLRLGSDAHIVAQLITGGQFSDVDDSWIALLGLTSRVRMSYTNGPWELSVSARRKFGDGAVRARFTYTVRF